jgi:hypothetical protein
LDCCFYRIYCASGKKEGFLGVLDHVPQSGYSLLLISHK